MDQQPICFASFSDPENLSTILPAHSSPASSLGLGRRSGSFSDFCSTGQSASTEEPGSRRWRRWPRGTMMGPGARHHCDGAKRHHRRLSDAIGTVTPVYTDSITAQVTGVITAVHYREGQFVHKGRPADRHRFPAL